MSVPPTDEVLGSIREVLRIDTSLREHRVALRKLNNERSVHRTRIMEYYPETTRLVTPYGNVVLQSRESPVRFTLEDIRDILQTSDTIPDSARDAICRVFEEEADRNKKTTRTLTVRRQQTLKRRGHRKSKKTLKNQHSQQPGEDTQP
jgi:hypothetical protein